jgi:hypothetical protein
MFARRPNGFEDFRQQEHAEEATELMLLERITFMNNIVYPAIDNRTKVTMAKYRKQFDKHNLIIKDKFKPGAIVMVRNELRSRKAEERFTGPFKVKERRENGVYTLVDAIGTEFTRAPSALKLVQSNLDAAEVQAVLDERKDAENNWEYLVQWKNTDQKEWVAVRNFHDYGPIRTFLEQRLPKRQKRS